jgi:GxxExxY protein
MLHHREPTERIIGIAIEVHRHSGPGLLEPFYAAALCRELERAGIRVRREAGIPAM